MGKGTLYLVPTALGGPVAPLLPRATMDVLQGLEHFIVENPRSARAFLKAAGYARPLQGIAMQTLDEHTRRSAIAEMLRPLREGIRCGLLSEAGCPAIADPGAALIREAHRAEVRVVPLVGPSALLLAVMASGLNGQRFAFHGYLPVERTARLKKLGELERESDRIDVTQVFIETPYRNETMFDALVACCQHDTLVCIATDLTLPTESVITLPVSDWKNKRPSLNRRPSVFLLYREQSITRNRG